MIHENWGFLVKKHFDFTQSNIPEIGDRVTGYVVANAHFGIWLDIGSGIPALLEIIQLNEKDYPPEDYPQWMPEIGDKIIAKVLSITENSKQINLSQKSLYTPSRLKTGVFSIGKNYGFQSRCGLIKVDY